MYSLYLEKKKPLIEKLVRMLAPEFTYVSVLGKHITGKRVSVSTTGVSVSDTGEAQCGFVSKIYHNGYYSEYSFSDIDEASVAVLSERIRASVAVSDELEKKSAGCAVMEDAPLTKDFVRPMDGRTYSVEELVEILGEVKNDMQIRSEKIVNASVRFEFYEVSALFVSENRNLTQNYSWASAMVSAVSRDGEKIQDAYEAVAANSFDETLSLLRAKAPEIADLSVEMLSAEMIEPVVYDIITTPSITGLIAHEAFGHGVEMDMFVKKRAKSRNYIGKPVASALVNMHDGAGVRVPFKPSEESFRNVAASTGTVSDPCIGYFFDDDGVLAKDTQIIKDGILQTGISDAVSAAILGTEPTGNGRRQDPSRKAYTRMTNTFFAPGESDLQDMIASIDHGYMLYTTNNGMEDPKNWNIQCVAQFGREIKDGKFTGKIVSPVVMSGYVPDLLMSVSMVSKEWQIIGSGHCGKGYKEWVPVSDGGPYLKCRCKLG